MNAKLILSLAINLLFINSGLANQTMCASQIFADKLTQSAKNVNETDSEETIEQWIYSVFTDKETVSNILKCPEMDSFDDNETITFTPVQYVFPQGRQIIVNYKTQPKILEQRAILAEKKELPDSDKDNPRIGTIEDMMIWTNTDPAWYAIMVVESGTLKHFVGPDKNNTVSLEYIENNIKTLSPKSKNGICTNDSAWANDRGAINKAGHLTVDIENDTNDYYVAGDINLEWVGYAEIALDVAITVATAGSGAVISGAAKSARAARAMKGMATSLRQLNRLDIIKDYVGQTKKAAELAKDINLLDKTKDAAKIADKTAELDKLKDSIKTLEQNSDVKTYKETSKTFADLKKYRQTLKSFKTIKQRGNIVARGAKALKSAKAAMSGNKLIAKGAKLGRASKFSSRVNDFLFHSTMKNIGKLGKMETMGGLIYGSVMAIGGAMFDFTESSTGDFTNDIEFRPLLLLSADDLQQDGQADKVNYGMWLMWAGDSTVPEDDDAAYLQAMDFAAKFYEDLMEVQGDTNTPCNVDIYVAKPIIKNPGSEKPELYYLIMNDTPWSTNP